MASASCGQFCADGSTPIDANVNLKAIQACMGHGSISVTLDVYGHMLPTGIDDLCAKADVYLGGIVEGNGGK